MQKMFSHEPPPKKLFKTLLSDTVEDIVQDCYEERYRNRAVQKLIRKTQEFGNFINQLLAVKLL